ncbi:MAG: PEP-CTERM sorting domain-containing protein [Planctomycetota bacterium]
MKRILSTLAVAALLVPGFAVADIATFDSAQGWVDGSVSPTTQMTQTSGLRWLGNQNDAYVVDSTAGTLSVASSAFLRQTFDLGFGNGGVPGANGVDIETGGSATLRAIVDPSGLNSFSGNRIILEIALANTADPFNATTASASPNGVQLRSNGTNWFVDEPAFGVDNNMDTGIALADGPLDVALEYEEIDASTVEFELFLNGTSFYTATLGGGITGGDLYGWTNTSQGTGTGGTLAFNSLELTLNPAAIPEPSTLGILGLGLLGLVSRRRRS